MFLPFSKTVFPVHAKAHVQQNDQEPMQIRPVLVKVMV